MNISELKNLLGDFSDNVSFNFDLKKKIGLILEENLKFFTKQKI